MPEDVRYERDNKVAKSWLYKMIIRKSKMLLPKPGKKKQG